MTQHAGDDEDGLARVHADAAAFYSAQLHTTGPGAAAARALLQTRAVPPAAVEAYGLGYAPAGWTSLTRHLRTAGHPDERLLAAGLSLRSRHDALVDRFRDRVMFPVHHPSGNHLIAFLGRLVPAATPAPHSPNHSPSHVPRVSTAEAAPKYLNSPQTASYHKGEVLYGLGAAPARQALAAGAVPVLVEGPLDAIAVTCSNSGPPGQVGPGHVLPVHVGVAPCGTALTAAQVAVLQAHAGPLAERGVGTAFDHDPAGAQAGLRAFALLRAAGAWPTAVVLPAGLDPSDLTALDGPAALAAALHAAGPLADLVVDAHLDAWADRLRWAEGRIGATRTAAHLLASFPPEQVGRQVHRVAERLGLQHSELTRALLEAVSPDRPQPPPQPARGPGPPTPGPAMPGPPMPGSPCAPAPPSPARLAAASYPSSLPRPTGTAPPSRAGPPTSSASSTAPRRAAPPGATTTDPTTHR